MKLIVFLMLIGCSVQTAPFPNEPVTSNVLYSKHIGPIVQSVCIRCHNDFNYDKLVYLKYSLWTKIVIDKSMPIGYIMDNQTRALFRDWINQGMKK